MIDRTDTTLDLSYISRELLKKKRDMYGRHGSLAHIDMLIYMFNVFNAMQI